MSGSWKPVVVRTLEPGDTCTGVERVRRQRASAYAALARSARESGARVEAPFAKDADDAPLPNGGWCWSVSHTRALAAGVVARGAVGIDVEAIGPRSEALVSALAAPAEWACIGGFSWTAFARVWTAKEAVLKKERIGLGALSRCTLLAVPVPDVLVLAYDGREHQVVQRAHADHVVSVATDVAAAIEWIWEAA